MRRSRPSIWLLGVLTAIDAIAIDLCVPALPSLQRTFAVDAVAAQATLSVFFAGLAAGQAAWGPASDRFGRRPPLLIGLAALVAGSILAAAADSLAAMLFGRFLQAIGASAGLVLARAVVNDLWPADRAARLYSQLMQILGLATMIAPVVGGALLLLGSWRWIFVTLTAIGVIALVWTWRSLPESRASSAVADERLVEGWLRLVRLPGFAATVMISALTMAAMFVLLTGFSFLFIGELGWSSTQFSILYGGTSIGFVLACQLNILALARTSAARVLRLGLAGQLLLALVLTTLVLGGGRHAPTIAILFAGLISSLGFTLGNAVSEAMGRAPPALAGAASGAIGVTQFSFSALVTPLATLDPSVSRSTVLTLLACAVAASLLDLCRRVARVRR